MTGKCESFEKQNVVGVDCIKEFGQSRQGRKELTEGVQTGRSENALSLINVLCKNLQVLCPLEGRFGLGSGSRCVML